MKNNAERFTVASRAELAFETMLERLQAVPPDQINAPSVDIQPACATAYDVATRDREEPRRGRFQAFADIGMFAMNDLDDLATMALAGRFARRRQLLALGQDREATVRAVVGDEAYKLRRRMVRVVRYHLAEHPKHGGAVTRIGTSTGYVEVANDLHNLADLYQDAEIRPVIEHDRTYYRAGDEARARELAETLFEVDGLDLGGEGRRWTDLTHRAWTVMFAAYQSVRRVGQMAFRELESVDVTYPSIVSAARSRPRRAREGDEPDADPIVQPPTIDE